MNQRVAPRPDNAIRRLATRITGTGPRWQQVLRWTAALSVGGFVLGAVTFFALYQLIDIPDRTPTSRRRPRTSTTPTASTSSARSPRRTARTSRSTRCRGHAGGRHRRRGPHVLLQPRHRHPGHHPRRPRQRAERRDHRRRLHDHAAVRQDPVPLAGAVVHPQGPRGDPLDQDPQPAEQAGDPRGLPQHHLLRQRRLRRPGRLADVLRQAGLQARRPGVGRSRHDLNQPSFYDPYSDGGRGAA